MYKLLIFSLLLFSDTTEIYQKALPAVLEINSKAGIGCGFIISKEGLAITSYHVISKGEFNVKNYLGKTPTSSIISVDKSNDLAIIKLDGKDDWPYLKLAQSFKIGQEVVCIGHPYSYKYSINKGIISGKNRQITGFENVIQTNVGINPGNSGGPLLNIEGEIVGVVVAMHSGGDNIGFAVPIQTIKQFLKKINIGE